MSMTDEGVTLYVFSFEATTVTEGVIGTKLSPEETQKKVEAQLEQSFGPDGAKIVEFRQATDEETLIIKAQFERSASPQQALN